LGDVQYKENGLKSGEMQFDVHVHFSLVVVPQEQEKMRVNRKCCHPCPEMTEKEKKIN
jgi:hypothetical protein